MGITPEYIKRANLKYKNRLRENGIKFRGVYLNDAQWGIVKMIADCIKEIENIEEIEKIDVSEDYLTYKLVK